MDPTWPKFPDPTGSGSTTLLSTGTGFIDMLPRNKKKNILSSIFFRDFFMTQVLSKVPVASYSLKLILL
jgi:hypothetical protein